MNKKVIIGIVAVIAVVALIAIIAVFALHGNEEENSNTPVNSVNNENVTQEEIDSAKDLQEYYPDKTEDEIIKMGKEELTTDQDETFDKIIQKYDVPEIAEVISTPADQDLENERPTLVYKDTEGNIVEEEISEEIWNMTPEEAEEKLKQMGEDARKSLDEYTERWEKKQNGEQVEPLEPQGPNNDNNELFPPTEDSNGGKLIYGGFNTYEEYIEDLHQQYPKYSIEQLKEAFPDQATGEVDHSAITDAAEGRLSGS